MCVSRHVDDCVFLEEAHPQMAVQSRNGPDDSRE
jgi:hypothetical protein